MDRSTRSGSGAPGMSSEESVDMLGLNPTFVSGPLLSASSSASTSSTTYTVPPATTLPGPSSREPATMTIPPEQLLQIAGAVADILRHPSTENPLVSTVPSSVSVTEGIVPFAHAKTFNFR